MAEKNSGDKKLPEQDVLVLAAEAEAEEKVGELTARQHPDKEGKGYGR